MGKKYFLSLILLGVLLISSCSTDTEYSPPLKVEPTVQAQETPTTTLQQTTPTPEKTATPTPEPTLKIQIFKVGETATDNQLKVSLNKADFVSSIDEQNNEFLVAEAPEGKKYLVLDLTVENILTDKTQTVSTMMQTTVNDNEGYNYDLDFSGIMALENSFKDGEILPGMKKRGELAYLVPKDSTGLKFIFKFDMITGTSAVFNIN